MLSFFLCTFMWYCEPRFERPTFDELERENVRQLTIKWRGNPYACEPSCKD